MSTDIITSCMMWEAQQQHTTQTPTQTKKKKIDKAQRKINKELKIEQDINEFISNVQTGYQHMK